jgi:hypothetical protein
MLDSSSSPSANCIAANFLLTECHVAKIATFCGPFAAKLCTAVPENYVARMLSRRFFLSTSGLSEFGTDFYVFEIARFFRCF